MTGSIKQIEQDISDLEEAIARITEDLKQAYTQYLDGLGQAVRQQLTLATYHLCTQGYPEAFLKLPFSERQNFQQELRHLAQVAHGQLRDLIHTSSSQSAPEGEYEVPEDTQTSQTIDEELDLITETDFSELLLELSSSDVALTLVETVPSLPESLMNWQEKIDADISKTLRTLSRDVNFLIRRSRVLPQKLPEKLLEVASTAETAETIASPPNLINLMIEVEDLEQGQSAKITRLMAIHLRLNEIEFADATVMAGRHQIRNLMGKLNKIRREYRKKFRERAVLEAEAAWRSSWFEDESE
ncbi:MAG: hypothetical protein HC835_03930 [Oscillatoriales cyanobacterium RM2_1_1]|nr:hypothetical protein [Oscillatoriales cyanobacterium SM2_3_0]NJO44832.1 hypothetical protein [Oscillatoriales cyanobacterium RM2_1_1]